MKAELTYNSRIDRYVGIDSDGVAIQVDADVWAEAVTERINGGMDSAQAVAETSDPDGWTEDMDGYIPAGEHL